MNFTTIDAMDITLKPVILLGLKGLAPLETKLMSTWNPDVQRSQKRHIVAGLGTVRPLANVASAAKEGLWNIPRREYRKDGRWYRAATKGGLAFVKGTTMEVARLGGWSL